MTQDLIIVSNYAPMFVHAAKARILVSLVSFLYRGVCAKSGFQNYTLLRKRVITIKDVRPVHHALQSSLKHFPQAKYNSASHVRHAATKLSEIVGSFRISNIREKIAYAWMLLRTQMSSGCAIKANLAVN